MSIETIELLRMAALFHASRGNADIVFGICSVEDFNPGHQQEIAAICVSLLNSEGRVDPMSVYTRCSERSPALLKYYAADVAEWHYGTPTYCARKVRDAADKQRLDAALTRAAQQVTTAADISDIVARLQDDISRIARNDDMLPDDLTLDNILDLEDSARPWVVPNMLRNGEVLLLTGWEGAGKSLLTSQVALGAACGVNTMTLNDETHDPVRVYVLDVENDPIDVRDNMRKIWPLMREKSGGVKPSITFSALRFSELTNTRDRRNVISRVSAAGPSLVTMGSVYKLAPVTDHEVVFNAIMTTVREIQERTGAAFMIEHHAGNQRDSGNERESRPYGSSMWRRWPNFGIGLVRHPDLEGIAELVRWRGDRARGRTWPWGLREKAFRDDTSFPWIPMEEADAESRIAKGRRR